MSNKIDINTLDCGITVICEQMPAVKTAAMNIKLPCGSAQISDDMAGAGKVIGDWLFRGTQSLTSKELVDAMDGLGLHRSSGVNSGHITLSAAMESSNLLRAIELYSQIVQSPRFDHEQFEFARQTAVGELTALDDDPRQKVMLKLKEQFYPQPFNRNPMGTVESLDSLKAESLEDLYKNNLDLSKTIFSFAGNIDPEEICGKIENLFNNTDKKTRNNIEADQPPKANYRHIPNDGAQVHIGIATPAVTMKDANYYNTMIMANAFGGGMSSRLFTEVREKRGLCYAVGARYQAIKIHAGIGCYAGTVPEKAQETLDIIIDEFGKLQDGISGDELDRAKVGLKSSLIMSSESSSARASNLGSDYYMLDKVRTLGEIKESIDSASADAVNDFLKNYKFEDFTICTIGPKEIVPPQNQK